LSPGYTDTPGVAQFMTDDAKAAAAASVPLGRLATPDDLGKAAVFLASDESAYVTGIELLWMATRRKFEERGYRRRPWRSTRRRQSQD